MDGTIWVVGGGDDRSPGHRLDKDGEYERGINAIVGFRPSDGTWRASAAPPMPRALGHRPRRKVPRPAASPGPIRGADVFWSSFLA